MILQSHKYTQPLPESRTDLIKALTLYLRVSAAVIFSVLMTGCRAEDPLPDGEPTVPEGVKTAVFSLSIPNLSPQGRADGVTGEHEGECYDSYIGLTNQDYRFLFFDSEGKYLETLQVESLTMASSNPVDLVTIYRVEGIISDALAHTQGVKVLALANWGDYSIPREAGVTTITDICDCQNAVFEYTLQADGQGLFPSESNLIPLYGVSNPQTFSFDPDTHRAEMEPMHLLRAYAKIEVAAKFEGYSDLSKCSLTGVTLSRHNTSGCKAPKDILSASDYVPSGTPGEWGSLNGVHLPQDVQRSDTPVSFVARPEEKDTYVLYVPEYINLNPNGTPRDLRAEMTLTFEVPERNGTTTVTKTDPLEFKYYSALLGVKEGDYFNLCRNVWYRYTVTKSPTNLTVDLQPYALADVRPDFGLDRDKDGNILVRDANGKLIKIIPYDKTLTPSLQDIVIGDMSYVEVKFNDVVNFREFLDSNGRPNGRRQDFLATGWNIYDASGSMEYCFIYDTPKDPTKPSNQDTFERGTWMRFDRFDNMLERRVGCTENDNWTSHRNDGTLDVRTDQSSTFDDIYRTYYLMPGGKWEALQSILIVYEVEDNITEDTPILAVVVEEGKVDLIKEHKIIETGVVDRQFCVEVYEIPEGKTVDDKVLRYRYFNDGARSVFHFNTEANAYDWDYYDKEGWRFSGFDHMHSGYGNRNVYSRYDKWGNLISRSLDASDDDDYSEGTHNARKMIVDNYPAPDGDGYIIKLRDSDGHGDYDFTQELWTDAYLVRRNGDKTVLIN